MKKVLRRIDNQRKSEINQLENFSEPFLMKILVQPNEPIVGFWCQIIVQKFLQRFKTSFEIKNYGENIWRWIHFSIPQALSELPANSHGLTSLSGWIGWVS